ncbi:helix-turn-helix transcriptional regulator [Paenarthrobacter nicotinovorans]|uniref:helix-turn-helix transcriptional regulator n=1 Tax=Paenarthrobacter nicotinovorans TaxID=29320 RepID=UPI001668E2CD|nr:helix-turn-helix domain-containing protein [Paenarthrobacter nicotinovorans]MBP2395149.1 AraC-like DNA-binding protein [Paenarthrobacter nicotinovorans]UKE98702.1 AraC family transcriptional regulator [Paenarthrobacter nicotinovorans]UKF03491.1 AraC family transcriptional regulator [Paenarthrobacter nicotinovorans]GGV36728.1 AraC family transcriptional regulator [Paenarthrobacter nicotinovorans]
MDNWSSYRQPAHPLRDLGLACLGAGEQSGVLPSFSERTLSSHAMVLVSEGSGHFTMDGARFEVQAPAVIWLFPGVSHGYGPEPLGWKEHWLLFSGPMARAMEELGCFARTRPLVRIDGHADEAGLGLFPQLRAALSTAGRHGDLEASVLCQRILVETGRRTMDPGLPGRDDKLLTALHELAHLPLSLSQLAASMEVSVPDLRRTVRAATGTGPKELVLQLRISRAQSLLADTALSVQRIATLTGYDDPAYFSRLFTKKTGHSPIQFRRLHHRDTPLP